MKVYTFCLNHPVIFALGGLGFGLGGASAFGFGWGFTSCFCYIGLEVDVYVDAVELLALLSVFFACVGSAFYVSFVFSSDYSTGFSPVSASVLLSDYSPVSASVLLSDFSPVSASVLLTGYSSTLSSVLLESSTISSESPVSTLVSPFSISVEFVWVSSFSPIASLSSLRSVPSVSANKSTVASTLVSTIASYSAVRGVSSETTTSIFGMTISSFYTTPMNPPLTADGFSGSGSGFGFSTNV